MLYDRILSAWFKICTRFVQWVIVFKLNYKVFYVLFLRHCKLQFFPLHYTYPFTHKTKVGLSVLWFDCICAQLGNKYFDPQTFIGFFEDNKVFCHHHWIKHLLYVLTYRVYKILILIYGLLLFSRNLEVLCNKNF